MVIAKDGFTSNVKTPSFKRIPSRTTIHMHARPTSNIWYYFAVSVSEEDRRKKRTKRKV